MSTFQLKIVAMIAMVVDHIAYFFPECPVVFHWIGRIAAPIFIFCVVNGVLHTKSKKRYLGRLYVSSVLMALIQAWSQIEMNFLRTLFLICLILSICEKYRDNKLLKKKYLIYFLAYQIVVFILCGVLAQTSYSEFGERFSVYVLPALLGNIFCAEGGIPYIILGVILYVYKDRPKQMAISYSVLAVLLNGFTATAAISSGFYRIGRICALLGQALSEGMEYLSGTAFGIDPASTGGSIFLEQYQWMMVFAIPILLKFNGKRGMQCKYFFYVFYPTHIVLLWLLAKFFVYWL